MHKEKTTLKEEGGGGRSLEHTSRGIRRGHCERGLVGIAIKVKGVSLYEAHHHEMNQV